MEEAQEFALLPVDAIVSVQCTEINEKHVPGKDGKEGWNKLEFTFVIDAVPSSLGEKAQELVGSKIWGSCAARFTTHPDNKLRQWTTALLGGMELNEGFELDTDVLINRKARAVITQYKKQNGSMAHQVGGLLPVVSASPAAPVSTPAPTGDLVKDTFAGAVAHSQAAQPVLTGGWDDAPPF
jgi:hypothetical protein